MGTGAAGTVHAQLPHDRSSRPHCCGIAILPQVQPALYMLNFLKIALPSMPPSAASSVTHSLLGLPSMGDAMLTRSCYDLLASVAEATRALCPPVPARRARVRLTIGPRGRRRRRRPRARSPRRSTRPCAPRAPPCHRPSTPPRSAPARRPPPHWWPSTPRRATHVSHCSARPSRAPRGEISSPTTRGMDPHPPAPPTPPRRRRFLAPNSPSYCPRAPRRRCSPTTCRPSPPR